MLYYDQFMDTTYMKGMQIFADILTATHLKIIVKRHMIII